MKRVVICIFALIVLSGCVAREQFVEKQVYTCTVNPEVSLKINDELNFVASFGENKSVYAPDASHIQRKEAYLFAKSTETDTIDKALVITSQQILQEGVAFELKCSWWKKEYAFNSEYSKFLNKRSCHVVSIAAPEFFTTLGVDLMDDKVDVIEGQYYVELKEIIVGGNRQISYTVAYLEKIKHGVSFYSFSDGMSVDELSKVQREEYEQFLENSRNAFERIQKG
ncbi:MAG: hypothetical protein MI863_06540 [Desulfobacterales bacterium]|nr:hypothetical protein [Desulfobacterales bacterium]